MNNIFQKFLSRTGMAAALLGLLLTASACEKEVAPAVSSSWEEMVEGKHAHNVAVTIISNTHWTAESNAIWCNLSQNAGYGTVDIDLILDANTSDRARTATITITTNSGEKSYITVKQNGNISTQFRVTPQTITIGAKPVFGNSFSVASQYTDAHISAAVTSFTSFDGQNWISNLHSVETTYGENRTALFTFDAAENTDSEEREAIITVTIVYARHTYTETVRVIQAGLGSPAVSTQMNVYLAHSQTAHSQTVWVEAGDQTNVSYDCHITCNNTATGAVDVSQWITSACVESGVLALTATQNTFDQVREGDILVVAKRNNATTRINVHVIQAGHKCAGLHLPVTMVSHNYKAATDLMVHINALNDSDITIAGNNSGGWVHTTSIDSNSALLYSLDEYNGSEGEYREATIILCANNGHSNCEYYYLTVRQYAPLAAGISLTTQRITHNAGAVYNYLLPLNPLNGSQVEVVSVTAPWVQFARINDNNTLHYHVAAYNGAQGESREAVITLKATNAHNNAAYYQITVCQYAPAAAGMDLPSQEMVYDYQSGYKAIQINALNGSDISVVNPISAASWITNVDINRNNGQLVFRLQQFAGGQSGQSRQATLILRARNANFDDAYYYVTIRQNAPELPSLSVPVEIITHSYAAGTVSLPLSVQPGTTVVASTDAAWVLNLGVDAANVMSCDLTQNNTSETREALITLTATNANSATAVYYVTIRQYAQGAPMISALPDQVVYDYNAGLKVVYLNALNGANVSVVNTALLPAWITGTTINPMTGNLNFSVTAFSGGQSGQSREAVIALRARNSNANDSYYYLTVRQNAPELPSISIPVTSISRNYTAGTASLPLSIQQGTSINASENATWITSATVNASNVLNVVMTANNTSEIREAVVTLTATNANSANATYYVTVTQYPQTAPAISQLPNEVVYDYNAGLKVVYLSALNGATVSVVNTAMLPNWITGATINAGTGNLNFSVTAFSGGQAGKTREAVIVLRASNTNANDSYYYLTVRQNAPELPSISIPATAMSHDYTAGIATLPLSAQVGTTVSAAKDAAATWINSVSTAGNILTVDMAINNTAEIRESIVTLTATNANSTTATYYVTVVQYPQSAPAISQLPQTVVYDSQAGFKVVSLNAMNGATVTLVNQTLLPNWITGVTINAGTGNLNFSVTKFNGGQEGQTREAVITLRARNSNANDSYHYLTVRQNAPELPAITVPTTAISHDYTAGTLTLPLGIQNGTNVQASENATWITSASVASNTLSVVLTVNTTGEVREAIVTLTATNTNLTTATYYVTVVQYPQAAATISQLPAQVTLGSTGGSKVVYLGAQNGANVSVVNVSEAWVSGYEIDASGNLVFDYMTFTGGASGDCRECVITLKATNSNSNPSYYYLPVHQDAPAKPSMSMAMDVVTHSAAAGTIALPVSPASNTTFTVNATGFSWITAGKTASSVTITLAANTTGADREGYVTLTATSANAETTKYYITVRQFAEGMPSLSVPSQEMVFDFLGGAKSLPIAGANATSVSVVGTIPSWITSPVVTSSSTLDFTVQAYDGSAGASREATLTLYASNNSKAATYYVTVRQTAPSIPAISVPQGLLTFDATAQNGTLPLNPINGATVNAALVGTPSWITGVDATGSVLNFSLLQNATSVNREAIIALTASSTSSSATSVYYVTVRQYAAAVPTISGLPTYIGLGYQEIAAATPATISLSTQSGVTLSVVSKPAWMVVTVPNATLTYSVSEYSGTSVNDYVREGVIVIRARNTSTGMTGYYSINVSQSARNMSYLTLTRASGVNLTTLSLTSDWAYDYSDGFFKTWSRPLWNGSAFAPLTVYIENLPGQAAVVRDLVNGTGTDGSHNYILNAAGADASVISINCNSVLNLYPGHFYTGDVDDAFNLQYAAKLYVYISAYPFTQTLTLDMLMTNNFRLPLNPPLP